MSHAPSTLGTQDPVTAPLPSGPKLNIGCGPVQPDGWVNIDGSNRARLASRFWPVDRALVALGLLPKTSFGPHILIHDLFKPLPFADNSVACIYAGEVWEHFEYADTERLTADCFRVLAPGGVLRICVPDGPTFWGRYLELYQAERAKPAGTRSAKAIRDHVDLYFREIMTRRVWFGSIGHKHKWQFDDVQLTALFEGVGLTDVGRMPFHVSRIPDVSLVESSDFCIVEGTKPLPAR
jgi:predicted SAM-dependent methyltransferase